jgi:hypothetical protein
MTMAFVAALVVLLLGLKLASCWVGSRPPGGWRVFWTTPLPSLATLPKVEGAQPGDLGRALLRSMLLVLGVLAMYGAYWGIVATTGLSGIGLGYLGAPLVWGLGLLCEAVTHPLSLAGGRKLPRVHEDVFQSRDLSDFWGRRWNAWTSDWFRQVIFHPLRRQPVLAVAAVFAVSGLVHELVLNLPLWLLTGRNLFGSMMLYFGLQGLGMGLERRWLPRRTLGRRVFLWLVVLGPAPLIVNEAMLRALQLWP